MDKPKTRMERFRERLRNRYRLVVMNDDTFEERFSLRLTPLGLFILVGAVSIFMTTAVISLVAFTPLRNYIPGYGSEVSQKKDLTKLVLRTDSLETALNDKIWYLDNLKRVMNGDVKADSSLNKPDLTSNYKNIKFKRSIEDSILRSEIESKDKYAIAFQDKKNQKNGISSFFFFTPVKGLVTNSFKEKEEHFGIDIAAPENEAIKATLDGTVIFTGWSSETGYVIEVQHSNNLVSVYKHNSALMKKMGQYVKAGEVIGIIGNSGEQTTGTHLHFELWYNGKAIDPQDYIIF
jgi:murein DD-endopeptidase MepM/ murein hydrolase activator NlpD